MKKPDFYIVGAPKSGTTAMDSYLDDHPDISMIPKEFHYWGMDLKYMFERREFSDYQATLERYNKSKVLGEGAVWYMISEQAAIELKEFTPDAKIIIMLRNPIDAIPSFHSQMMVSGNEPEKSLKKALEHSQQRTSGKNLPDNFRSPVQAFDYIKLYKYSKQIQRYWDQFGKENVKIILFDDFVSNTPKVYKDLLSFLNLSTEFTPIFEVVNPNEIVRQEKVQKLILKPSKSLKSIVKTVIPSKKFREKVKAIIWQLNLKQQQREPINQDLKSTLKEEFKDEISTLEIMIQRDLSAWKE